MWGARLPNGTEAKWSIADQEQELSVVEPGRTAAAACLAAAGWEPDRRRRHVDAARYLDAVAERGFAPPTVLADFYAEYGGLTLTYPNPRYPEQTDTYVIDPGALMADAASVGTVETWGEWAGGARLCPFGEANGMTALISPDGCVWLGFEDLLLFVADSPGESLDVLCEGRETPQVPPPADYVRPVPSRYPDTPDVAGGEQLIREAVEDGGDSVDLSGLGLREVPQSLYSLAGLTELTLNDNALTELPDDLFEALPRLTRISASGNLLTALPKSLGGLRELVYLNLNGNELARLPDSIVGLERLQFLGLIGNRLRHLPDAIGNLASLTKLYAPGNELIELPTSITRLTGLRELWLSNNKLTSLPKGLDSLASLTALTVNGNPL